MDAAVSSHIAAHMNTDEKSLFERLLSRSSIYLEFGCGGSTILALSDAPEKIVSIESDPEWIAKLRRDDRVIAAERDGRLLLRHADLGPVGPWGTPHDESRIRQWPAYYAAPFLRLDLTYDLIFIDGRFRLPCALSAAAFAADSAVIAIHDYGVRPAYSEIENYFDIVDHSHTLYVMKKKNPMPSKRLYSSLFDNLFNYS